MKIGACKDCVAWQKRYDDLLGRYHNLRQSGAIPLTPARITPPQEPAEEKALRRAHDEFVPQLAKQFESMGFPAAKAKAEADRIRAAIDQPFSTGDS